MPRVPLRWVAIVVVMLSSTLNYLDRQLLAASAPALKSEFHLTNHEYGQILSIFSIVYAVTAPLAGVFIDRVGLNVGVSIAVLTWSLAGAATGLTHSFRELVASRTLLGIAEAAGIPCFGKANGVYLEPGELALGSAFNQVGVSLGLVLAPIAVAIIAPHYGWRAAFIFCGALGVIWTPIWWFTAKKVPAKPEKTVRSTARFVELLRDPRIWGLVVSTIFIMALYTLWTNWTTLYFVEQWHLTQVEANARFAWIPQVAATIGGFLSGWIAFHWIRRGMPVRTARMRVSWICGVAALISTAAVPFMPNVPLAAVAVTSSAFWGICISTNLYAMPIDMFGPSRAGFGVAVLTFAYGAMQAFLSPRIGSVVDRFGFNTVCFAMSALPVIGVLILGLTTKPQKTIGRE
ncbi:MAG TPA: MFS transporter [Bryobacteraceae bacterium]|nr:MFS transporter [Bryobacteraceae bacterium]